MAREELAHLVRLNKKEDFVRKDECFLENVLFEMFFSQYAFFLLFLYLFTLFEFNCRLGVEKQLPIYTISNKE